MVLCSTARQNGANRLPFPTATPGFPVPPTLTAPLPQTTPPTAPPGAPSFPRTARRPLPPPPCPRTGQGSATISQRTFSQEYRKQPTSCHGQALLHRCWWRFLRPARRGILAAGGGETYRPKEVSSSWARLSEIAKAGAFTIITLG